MSYAQTNIIKKSNVIKNTRSNIFRAGLNVLDIDDGMQCRLLVLGITSAGKSTLIEFLEYGAIKSLSRRPTLSFQFHKLNFGKIKMQIIDSPGQQSYWKDWPRYTNKIDGIIFMIDSTNHKLIRPLNSIVQNILLKTRRSVPIAFMANKQDISGAVSATTLNKLINFEVIENRKELFEVSSVNGKGLLPAFKWILTEISKSQKYKAS